MVSEGSCQREVPPTVRASVRLFSCVNPRVPPQLSRRHERLAALRAAVRFLSRVGPHVRCQSPLLRKCLPTIGAVVGRDASVEALVSHERARQGEPFITVRTLVRPLSCVSPLVISELRCRVTAFVTVRTWKLLPSKTRDHLRVHRIQMSFQMPVSGKALQTDGAMIRPLTSVSAPVQPELSLTGEPFLAESAWERLLPGMDPFVDHEQALFRKPLFAHRAGERPLSGVSAQVALEFRCVREVFPTHRAAVKEQRFLILTLIELLGGGVCRENARDSSLSCVQNSENTFTLFSQSCFTVSHLH